MKPKKEKTKRTNGVFIIRESREEWKTEYEKKLDCKRVSSLLYEKHIYV